MYSLQTTDSASVTTMVLSSHPRTLLASHSAPPFKPHVITGGPKPAQNISKQMRCGEVDV